MSTSGGTRRQMFGDVAIVLFLLAQLLDGVFTYVGVGIYGPGIEANPIIVWLMATLGEGPGVAAAKVAASGFGIVLHAGSVHGAVALLTAFYFGVAIVPWAVILFQL